LRKEWVEFEKVVVPNTLTVNPIHWNETAFEIIFTACKKADEIYLDATYLRLENNGYSTYNCYTLAELHLLMTEDDLFVKTHIFVDCVEIDKHDYQQNYFNFILQQHE